jgi:hypothetical protein
VGFVTLHSCTPDSSGPQEKLKFSVYPNNYHSQNLVIKMTLRNILLCNVSA